jgi:hypothetical protein
METSTHHRDMVRAHLRVLLLYCSSCCHQLSRLMCSQPGGQAIQLTTQLSLQQLQQQQQIAAGAFDDATSLACTLWSTALAQPHVLSVSATPPPPVPRTNSPTCTPTTPVLQPVPSLCH